MNETLSFATAVSHNPCLAVDATELHAIVTVTANATAADGDSPAQRADPGADAPVTGTAGAGPPAAEIILIDCSSSMAFPRSKMAAARRAAAAAIEMLPDGMLFAVVRGTDRAAMIYPQTPTLAVATADTRAAAKAAVNLLEADGGTQIGTWLALARQLFADTSSGLRHAILLTDGHDGAPAGQLDRVLADCAGQFVCDARGIGEDWEPRELLRIAAKLRGSADAVRRPADLEADFRAMLRDALHKVVPDLVLAVALTPPVRLRFLKQVYPTIVDLSADSDEGADSDGRAASDGGGEDAPDPRIIRVNTGSWGAERRMYHLCLDVADVDVAEGEEFCPARIDLLVREEPLAPRLPIVACRVDDPVRVRRIDPSVAHYTGQAELSVAIVAGCDAYDAGDRDRARIEWERAVRLATGSGNAEALSRLRQLVAIDPDGTVRVRDDIRPIDVKDSHLGSVISTPIQGAAEPAERGAAEADGSPDRQCSCGRWSPASARRCTKCGADLTASGQDHDAGAERRSDHDTGTNR